MLCQIAKFGLNEKITEVTTTSISYNGCGFNDVITDQVVVPHVLVPFRTCAAVAVPPTTLSSPAPPISQRPAQGPTGVPAPATMANDKVRLLSRNILPLVSTPINVVILERELSHHPNRDFSNSLINALRFGTHVGHTGPEKNRVSRNLISAVQHPEVVSSNLTKEISFGLVAGPFPSPSPPLRHFQCHPLGGVPKKLPQIGPPFVVYLIRRGAVLMIIYLKTLMHFSMLG